MKEEEKIILETDEDLIEYRTNVKGWVGKNKIFYGENKDLAIYGNITHKKCELGHIYDKRYSYCPTCKESEISNYYYTLKEKEWDGKVMLNVYDTDIYLSDKGDVEEYISGIEEEEDERFKQNIDDVKLVLCEPNYLYEITSEFWSDILPEGHELSDIVSKEFIDKLDELNKLIDDHDPISWSPTNTRTNIKNILNRPE